MERGIGRRRARRGMTALLVAAALVGVTACGGAGGGGDTIVIGVQGPFTGDYAAEGKGFRQAIELLKEQVNAEGGVLGKQVEVIYEDDKGQPNESTLAAQKLVSRDVIAVIGSIDVVMGDVDR